MQHGSLINHLESQREQVTPEVGMGATVLGWTDRHAYTIIWISHKGKRIGIQRDRATRTDKNGMSDAQSYTYEADSQGIVRTATLRSDGSWKVMGGGQNVIINWRDEHYDYSF